MILNRWVLLCSILALPCLGIANLIIFMGGPDSPRSSDRDNDGLPDAWEQSHFGRLDFCGSDDPDNDGVANAAELARGTRPFDPASSAVTLFVSGTLGNPDYDGLARRWDGVHGPKPSITTALAASLSGDTVCVLPGTYPEDINIRGMDVTIVGEGTVKGTP